ncbi:MAG TPA: hypothetical protein VIL64_01955 [Solirubrobacteraceae bacterium]
MLRRHAGEDAESVLVLRTLGAPERRRLKARRSRTAEPQPDPAPVPTTRATVVDASPLADESAADRWLDDVDGDLAMAEAVAVLNRVLHAHRVASADPAPRDVSREQALVARVGYGAGEEVADGRWSRALEVPEPREPRQRRTAALRPQERLAALLGGRDVAMACEELVLRARTDLDGGRPREAALTLRVALEAALAELEPWADRSDLAERLVDLTAARGEVGNAANRALQGGLDADEHADVERVLGRLEAALRARTASGLD